ncbi:MAG: signal peptidase I [Lachnospiraceae bacterium]|nr:signal peptidase I [Lachnospiraceae bacterium]
MDDKENTTQKTKDFSLKDIFQFIFLLAIIFLIIFIRQMPLFTVDGHSMDKTYTNGDLLAGKKNAPIHRKDILIIYSDVLSERIVKRCIGMPGDKLEIKDNVLYINGNVIKENYIAEPMRTDDMSVTLKDNEYFVMGDNRNKSTDSREIGPIPKDKIQARVTHNLTKEYHITTVHLKWFKRIVIICAACYIIITILGSFLLPLFHHNEEETGDHQSS